MRKQKQEHLRKLKVFHFYRQMAPVCCLVVKGFKGFRVDGRKQSQLREPASGYAGPPKPRQLTRFPAPGTAQTCAPAKLENQFVSGPASRGEHGSSMFLPFLGCTRSSHMDAESRLPGRGHGRSPPSVWKLIWFSPRQAVQNAYLVPRCLAYQTTLLKGKPPCNWSASRM